MPLIIKCRGCGYMLYYSTEARSLEYLNHVLSSLIDCPNCGGKLSRSIKARNIKVRGVKPITVGFKD